MAAQDVFLSAASPGVIALFLDNQYYSSREAYLQAIAEAMQQEYEAIAQAGLVLQLDCPDLAMGRHIQFNDASLDEFHRQARLNVEALNYAARNIDPDQMRMHLCWGNYEGPHHKDVPLRDIIDIVLTAPQRHLARGVQSAPRARVAGVRRRQAAGWQAADSGRHRFDQQLHRAP